MFENVKVSLNEVIEIANKCPDKYQVKCFEILLDSLVRGQAMPSPATTGSIGIAVGIGDKPEHPFFAKYSISKEEWTKVFHFDGNSYEITVRDLKEKTKARKQIKLGLLLGIKGLLETGTANLSKDTLFELCKSHVAYDKGNFATYMKQHMDWLLQKGDGWTLTVPGMEEAAKVIKEFGQ